MTNATTISDGKDLSMRVRMDRRDKERLARVAAHYELSDSATMRMLIRQAAEALPPEPTTKPTKRTK